jgi:hypothetical protein
MNRTRNRAALATAAVTALLVAAVAATFARSGSAAPQVAPSNQNPPTLSGTPEVGKSLTATPGTWTGTQPISFVYRYQRCNKDGADCFTGGSTTQRTYRLTSDDLGKTVRVRVTATNSDGAANASSAPTAVIRPATVPQQPAVGCAGNAPIQIASISQPERLLIDQALLSPPVIGRSTLSLTLRVHVSCRGKSVQGALVEAAAVPFNQFSSPPEQTTGADGFAQITMNQLAGFPAADRQQLLVLFLRARKSGENLLGGISTRRLVSFPVNLDQ